MKTIKISGNQGISTILIGERLKNLHRYLPVTRPIIITDVNVRAIYPIDRITDNIITIGTGEKIKTLETVRDIYSQLVSLKADRSSFIVGVGGGIVCDITGFVASTFLRGVRFGFVASTLTAQADASIGGKNGVNFNGYKNMIGMFNQPEFVMCDLDLLKTVPEREISCGFAEIVKHAAVANIDLFAYLEQHHEGARALDRHIIESLVFESAAIKSSIVNRDETERGERRILNFGHTYGHAIEKVTGIPHGEAVSRGMAVAAALSVKRGLLTAGEEQRVRRLLNQLRLPVDPALEPEKVFDAIGKDKKRIGESIHFVLLNGIGNAVVDTIRLDDLKDTIYG